jgi:hypothetical protein
MCAIRVYKIQFESRLDYIQHGWSDNNQRIVELSSKINLNPTTVEQILQSSDKPSEKKKKILAMNPSLSPLPTKPFPTLPLWKIKKAKTQETSSPSQATRPLRHLDLLPNVLLQHVSSYLPYRDKSCLFGVNALFYSKYFSSCKADLRTLTHFDVVEMGDLCEILGCTLFDMLALQENTINTLNTLGITPTARRNIRSLAHICCPFLNSLDSERAMPALTRITTVDLRANFGSTIYYMDRPIIAIAKNCSNLKVLRFSVHYSHFTPVFVAIGKHCKMLEELEIDGSETTNSHIKLVAEGCPLLARLVISDASYITDPSLIALTSCPNLIDLRMGLELASFPITPAVFNQFIHTHPNLEGIQLPPFISLKDLPALLQSCSSLRTLICYDFNDEQVECLKTLLPKCQKLEELCYIGQTSYLNISPRRPISNATMSTISEHASHVKRVHFLQPNPS